MWTHVLWTNIAYEPFACTPFAYCLMSYIRKTKEEDHQLTSVESIVTSFLLFLLWHLSYVEIEFQFFQ